MTGWDPSGSFQDLFLLSKPDEELFAFVPFSIVSARENKHLFNITISFSFVFSLKGILTFRKSDVGFPMDIPICKQGAGPQQ